MHQTRFREIISCADTWRCEAFVVEHSLIVRIRIQHIKFSCEYERTFGIISFTQLNLFMVLVHFRSSLTSTHSTCISDSRSDNSCVTSLTQFATSVCIKAHNHQCFRTLFPFTASTRKSERSRTCNSCAHRHNSRVGCNCGLCCGRCFGLQRRSGLVHTSTDSQREYTHCIIIFRTVQSSIECPTRRSILELLSLDFYNVLIIQLRDILQTGCSSRLHPQ